MNNIATIYRFKTPFLDISQEKENLISVIKKIEKSLEFDGIDFTKESYYEGNYYKIVLNTHNDFGRLEFFYIKDISDEYYLPIFKFNIFISLKYLKDRSYIKNIIPFLSNIFECFDGLNEKEFLIDIDNSIYYKEGFFSSKQYPDYDFSDIDKIQEKFESNEGLALIEDFINKFKDKKFFLSVENSAYYHSLHSIFLYFIYLIFIMYQNMEKSNNIKKEINDSKKLGIYEENLDFVEKRLDFVDGLHFATFEKYKNRLELFFKLF